MSMLGACWAHAYFKERPNFGAHTTSDKKETCIKKRKSSMQEEKQRGKQEGNPNHDRVRVFVKDCNCYKPIK
jgi:hypothetical protein